MTQKYKLAPIESTIEMRQAADMTGDVWDVYTNMLAQCETVEVVEISSLKKTVRGYHADMEDFREDINSVEGYNRVLDSLIKNGYKIVKVCNE